VLDRLVVEESPFSSPRISIQAAVAADLLVIPYYYHHKLLAQYVIVSTSKGNRRIAK
jgi:hypothetical protein